MKELHLNLIWRVNVLTIFYFSTLFLIMSSSSAAPLPCEDLQRSIQKKLEDKEIYGYFIGIFDASSQGLGNIVGSCDSGTKKIYYLKAVENSIQRSSPFIVDFKKVACAINSPDKSVLICSKMAPSFWTHLKLGDVMQAKIYLCNGNNSNETSDKVNIAVTISGLSISQLTNTVKSCRYLIAGKR